MVRPMSSKNVVALLLSGILVASMVPVSAFGLDEVPPSVGDDAPSEIVEAACPEPEFDEFSGGGGRRRAGVSLTDFRTLRSWSCRSCLA